MTVATRLRTASGQVTPNQLAGLSLWLKADTLGLADDDPVATWADSSGAGNTATQAVSGNRPIYKTALINSLPVVRFFSDDRLVANSAASVFSGTDEAFSVVVAGRLNGINADQAFLSAGNSGTDTPRLDMPSIGANNVYRAYKVDDSGASAFQGGSTADTSAHILSVVCPGTTVGIWRDGAVVVAAGTGFNVGAATYDGVAVGAVFRASPVDHLLGEIAELVVYDRALTTTERQQVQRYLGTKYAIGVI